MELQNPITDILEESIITHEYTEDGSLVINLFLYINGKFIAKYIFYFDSKRMIVHLDDPNDLTLFHCALQYTDLCLSWMKAFEKGMCNQQMQTQ